LLLSQYFINLTKYPQMIVYKFIPRAALTACGWVGKFGMQDALAKLEARGKYERSAALAVWSSDIGEAVAALQRGADHVRSKESSDESVLASNTRYAETLELVAMCK
jgi:hypothetical protein